MIEEILNLRKQGKSINKIAKEVHKSTIYVSKLLKERGLLLREGRGGNKAWHKINESFFKKIDTEPKAYILGFLFADGNVSSASNQIKISLKRFDKKLLHKINKCMDSDYPVSNTSGRYSIEFPITKKALLYFCNKDMKKDLIKLGCMPVKSLILKFPTKVSEDLLRHFMRGYFDGDGSIYLVKQSNRYQFSLNSTVEFCKKYLKKLPVDTVTIHKEKRSKENVWYFRVSKQKDLIKIRDFFYEGATIFLERKKLLFDKVKL